MVSMQWIIQTPTTAYTHVQTFLHRKGAVHINRVQLDDFSVNTCTCVVHE